MGLMVVISHVAHMWRYIKHDWQIYGTRAVLMAYLFLAHNIVVLPKFCMQSINWCSSLNPTTFVSPTQNNIK